MSAMPIVLTLCFSVTAQFLLWFNLLFPYNSLFENFNRSFFLGFSLSGFFAAFISLAFYRVLVFKKISSIFIVAASVFQVLCIFSSIYFIIASLTGWLPI
jgi:hypothetical protein